MTRTGWLVLAALMAGGSSGSESAESPSNQSSTLTLPSGVLVTIVEAPFVPARNRIEGCSKEGGPCLINGHPPFGVSVGLPMTYVKSITVSFGGRSHRLDATDMYDAWEGRPLTSRGVRYLGGRCDGPAYCTIRGIFGDGAGTFVVQWSVYNGVASRNVISSADDLVDLFMKHIDPPEYD